MKNLTLKNIAGAIGAPLNNAEGKENTEITCAVVDSRKIEPGGLFFAANGEKVDGHKFIDQVLEKGAALIICTKTPDEVEKEHGIPAGDWGPYIVVEDSYDALKKVAAFYRDQLEIPIVGITGSVGKTSTKEFIATVLSEKYNVLKTEGNFNNEIGLPITLLRIRGEHEAAVVEMGISDFGEMSRLGAMAKPDICVITNIGQCHLENLHDRQGVRKAKTEIFDYLKNGGTVCLNRDDDLLAEIKEVNGKPVYFFGLSDVTEVVNNGLLGSEAILHMGDESFPITIHLPGIHMVKNACAAALVGQILGLDKEQIRAGIENVKPVGGRSNLISTGDKLIIDDCYNANPVSMKAAIDLLKNAEGRTVALLGDMFELGEDSDTLHASVGSYAVQKKVDVICFAGENAKNMYDGAKTEWEKSMAEGKITRNERLQLLYFEDRESLVCHLDEILKPGDTILVKASQGMGFSKVVEKLCS